MYICKHCLQAIESHEGYQVHKRVSWEDVSPELIIEEGLEEFMVCEWCDEETPIDEMVEV